MWHLETSHATLHVRERTLYKDSRRKYAADSCRALSDICFQAGLGIASQVPLGQTRKGFGCSPPLSVLAGAEATRQGQRHGEVPAAQQHTLHALTC